jgi:hypothetical protein
LIREQTRQNQVFLDNLKNQTQIAVPESPVGVTDEQQDFY